jgi:hypothetical protein
MAIATKQRRRNSAHRCVTQGLAIMVRIRELMAAVRKRFPDDVFFTSGEDSLLGKLDHYKTYDAALMCLDDGSWNILKEKAIQNFPAERKGQTKQPFFNLLNEAFAYQYLLRKGLKNVRFMKEDGIIKTPDISYVEQEMKYCEVKSIGISDDEIKRRYGHDLDGQDFDVPDFYRLDFFDGKAHTRLSDGFLNKLLIDVNDAREQIAAVKGTGIVFVLARFDDFTRDYIETYRAQLRKFCDAEKDVVLKLEYMGNDIIGS